MVVAVAVVVVMMMVMVMVVMVVMVVVPVLALVLVLELVPGRKAIGLTGRAEQPGVVCPLHNTTINTASPWGQPEAAVNMQTEFLRVGNVPAPRLSVIQVKMQPKGRRARAMTTRWRVLGVRRGTD